MQHAIEVPNMGTTVHWWGGLSLGQVDQLVSHFAYLTEDGWKVPLWLEELAAKVVWREHIKISSQHLQEAV